MPFPGAKNAPAGVCYEGSTDMAMCKVQVMDVRFDVRTQSWVVILRDSRMRDMYLPIWVGESEAHSIQLAIEKKAFPRPLTHDLITNILDIMGVRPVMLKIHRIVDQTYFAEIGLERDDARIEVDCRPSDGIALALRKNVPIFAEEMLLYKVETSGDEEPISELESELGDIDHESFITFLEGIRPRDFLGASPGEESGRED